MNARSRSLFAVAREVVGVVREKEVTFLAASISYYTLVSLIPLLVVGLVAATLVGGPELRGVIMGLASEYLLPSGEAMIEQAIADRTGGGGVTVVGLGISVWGALKLFRGLDVAFARVYGTETAGFVEQVREGLVALLGIGVGIVGVVVLGAVVALAPIPYIGVLSPLLLLAMLVATFFPIYYVLPQGTVTPRQALPGTVFAALGWTLLGTFFGVYASLTGGVAGALGALLLLVTYFYLAGMVLLTGAVVNAVLADRVATDGGRAPDRQLQQPGGRHDAKTDMSEDRDDVEPRGAPDIADLEDRVDELRADLDAFETDVDERTVKKPELEAELKRYVKRRMRRGKARGWGPYLVLLYGTVMTLGAFYFLRGVWAILAMVVLFLSTLGLYVVFIAVGFGLNLLDVPGRAVDAVRDRRS